MGDRDIPSVPVTTLAGLTSTSDLLSELPVSDCLQSASSFNKSLLFHSLVANESNNLLSVRDENLVRQLVNAIEQTNSDNIELKPQYAIHQHGANISTYPELLQGIYNYRPTVFNTPRQNAINDHTVEQHLPEHLQKKHPTHSKQTGLVNNVNDICREAYNFNANYQHPHLNEYVHQSISTVAKSNLPGQRDSTSSRSQIESIVSRENIVIHEEHTSRIQSLNANHHGEQLQAYYHQYQHKNPIGLPKSKTTNSSIDHNQLHQNAFQTPSSTTSTIQGNFQNVLNLQRQQIADGGVVQQQYSKPPSPSKSLIIVANNSTFVNDFNQCTNLTSTATSASTSSSGKSQVRSPEMARSMGLLQETTSKHPVNEYLSLAANFNSSGTSGIPKTESTVASCAPSTADMFAVIKADEKRTGTKRKLAISLGDIPPEQIYSKPKLRRVERIMTLPTPKGIKEEVIRSQTYQQFMKNMEQIIEMLDDTESPNFDTEDVDDNIECIPPKLLNTMSDDVAKLKAKQALDSIPKNKLTLLINYAMRNVYLARNYSAGQEDEDDIVDDEVIEKILNAMDACLLICNIYSTVSDLKFLQEDNISHIIKFAQFQLRETIFPLHDPVYTVKSVKKTSQRKKAKSHQSHHRNLQLFYSKVVELLKVFVTLFDKCIFVDTIVLPLSTLAIEPFFVDNIETLQFVCLELVTTVSALPYYLKCMCEYSDTSDSGSCDENYPDDSNKNGNRPVDVVDYELNLEIFNVLEERKRYLISKIKPFPVGEQSHQHIKTYIDYNNAQLIAQYLATKRPFSQSFDGCLKKIILVVNEPSIAVRTRAMKCLANIVEVDPLVLKRKDMQMGVNQKFLDTAISVREAAVDLVGKFVLSNQELIDQYYDMLSTRILDTGVSVRKRVIKILRDICIEYPDFEKIPEICVKMIRRVNDEEGIQKLVTEVFMKMWFTPCVKNDKYGIQRKINQIIDVVNSAHDTGTTWLEGLLMSIFKPKDNMVKLDGSTQESVKKNTEPPQEIVLACQQLADGLVDRLIELEDTDNARMLGCITTIHLLAKVRPQLLIRHAMTIEPYLNIKCHSASAAKFICAVADILEKVVPLVNNASESFLASLEEHLMLLVVSRNQAEVTSCVSCLGALVNKITKNFKLIRDCFQKFYRVLELSRNQVEQNAFHIDNIYTPSFRRSLFTIGILMRYFDFSSPIALGDANNGLPPTICDNVFECLMFFCGCSNHEIRKQALISLGSFCVMNDDYLTRSELKQFYCDLLRSSSNDGGIKIICMRNIWIYLTESEMFMHNKEKEWEKQSKHEDLKEMNDVSSGMASRIIQLYLEEILDCFLNRDDAVRLWAVKVVQIVLRQGLVHPVRMVPYLICLSTDLKVESAHRADALLKDIDKTYSGFVNMKVQFGLQLCFKLQEILQKNNKAKNEIIRGYAKRGPDQVTTALNDFLYTLLRTTKPQRRALVQTVTKQFDDNKTSLQQMLYIADNLAYFPYAVQDEPLYLIHQIDLLISMAGTHLLTTFKEHLRPSDKGGDVLEDDDDEEDPHVLFSRLPEDMTEIKKCITSAQACMLLLVLKEHLKEMYGLTDGKISRYSPSEQKLYEKAVTRRIVADFNPRTTIDVIKKQPQNFTSTDTDCFSRELSDEEKLDLVVKYLDFKKLMLKLDPEDADSDADESRDKTKLNNSGLTEESSTTPSQILNDKPNSVSIPAVTYCKIQTSSTTLITDTSNIDTLTFRTAKSALSPVKLNARKQNQQRNKKKRRKIMSSDEDDEYSGNDYS
ncbi:PREDICTED: nipped-B protein [Drosophila arizonae]|uniref:Nipped-B protein n=1 Tax=Drosophila arizonae TaxID=7263 RepID=A0ABM1NPM8_DROAR|nr:PREDICTED: nipped-B protein [Drosophila arizonae]